jgi:hypothetical protein
MSEHVVGFHHEFLSPDITGSENTINSPLHLVRGVNSKLTIYVDSLIPTVNNDSACKVAMLVEPITITPHLYSWIEENHDKFDMVLTHHKPLLKVHSKFRFYPVWPRIKMDKSNFGWDSPKSKNMSVIFSNKRQTSAQKYRHDIVQQFSDHFDLYGTGYQPIDDKSMGTKPYRYQVVVENIFSGYTSEKANDCFACGTIPIYYGNDNSNIHDYYDSKGIITFETLDELSHIINNVADESWYGGRLEAVKKNYELATNNSVHKVLWEHGISELF